MTLPLLLPPGAIHMAIDMQRVFAEPTAWQMQGFDDIVPRVAAIAAAMPGRSLFTRFVTPRTADDAPGRWQHYYRQWPQFTAAVMDPRLGDIVDALAPHATPATWLDKPTYSAFEVPDCAARLAGMGADTIVFTGVETDVCVLATLMAAIDRGFRVIAVADALGSSSVAGHDAVLHHVLPRMPDQVEISTTAAVLRLAQVSPDPVTRTDPADRLPALTQPSNTGARRSLSISCAMASRVGIRLRGDVTAARP